MAEKSKIEWTEATWNPIVGCSPCSPGCDNCYAAREASGRLAHLPKYAGLAKEGKWTGEVRVPDAGLVREPLRWKRPRTIFVGSMTDLFHPAVPGWALDLMFAVMAMTPHHRYLILTKRIGQANAYFTHAVSYDNWGHLVADAALRLGREPIFPEWPLSNVGLGVTVCNQAEADEKIPILLETPAAMRFVSYEPAIGAVDFDEYICRRDAYSRAKYWEGCPPITPPPRLDWVIVGGETGKNARPMHPDWVRSVRAKCVVAGVPFFFKQWGEWQNGSSPSGKNAIVLHDGRHGPTPEALGYNLGNSEEWNRLRPVSMSRVGKKAAGRLLDGREWNDRPERFFNRE